MIACYIIAIVIVVIYYYYSWLLHSQRTHHLPTFCISLYYAFPTIKSYYRPIVYHHCYSPSNETNSTTSIFTFLSAQNTPTTIVVYEYLVLELVWTLYSYSITVSIVAIGQC